MPPWALVCSLISPNRSATASRCSPMMANSVTPIANPPTDSARMARAICLRDIRGSSRCSVVSCRGVGCAKKCPLAVVEMD